LEEYPIGTELEGEKGIKVTVESKLNVGGSGILYEGKANRWGKCVIRQSFPEHKISEKKFKTEIKALQRLENHPRIPKLIDFDKKASPPFLVRNYIEGETLRERLRESGDVFAPLSESKARRYAVQILDILQFIHEKEISHNNIIPENLIVDENDEITLIDFNDLFVQFTKEGIIKTPGFGAPPGFGVPERWSFTGPDVRSDIYGVGTTLFFLLTGKDIKQDKIRKRCFIRSNEYTRLKRPSQFNPSVSKEMSEIVRKATKLDPDDRFQTASEMKEALIKHKSSKLLDKPKLVIGERSLQLDLKPGESYTMGRRKGLNNAQIENDIQISNPYVSDLHAEIGKNTSGEYWLEDKGKGAKTAVNPGHDWIELTEDQTWELQSGDTIALGYNKKNGPMVTMLFRN